MKNRVSIPYNYTPRHYQKSLYNAIADGYKRAVAVWHRRAGKDKTLINIIAKESFKRVGSYFYFFPEFKQGRKVLWEGKDKSGFSFLNHFPKEVVAKKHEQDMRIELVNGSAFQIVGTDDFDRIMGTNPVGCVFSEYSLQKAEVWDFTRPILRENGGWSIFNYTPRGHNHGYDIYRMAMQNPDWFVERLAACIHPKFNPQGEIPVTGVLTAEDIDAELAAGMSENMVRQEFFCDFDVSSDDILIPIQLVEAAFDREITPGGDKVMGIDVGVTLTGDPSAIVGRHGAVIIETEEFKRDEPIKVASHVRKVFEKGRYDFGYIDVIGWGSGVCSYLQQWGLPITGINVAERPAEKEKFNRLRDELWWRGREFFEARDCSVSSFAVQRGKLATELSTPTYTYLPNGKIKVQGKRELDESPNLADAFLLSLLNQHNSGGAFSPKRNIGGSAVRIHRRR